MDNIDFRNTFLFAQYTFRQYRHNAILPGAPTHYLGYLHEGYGRLQSREVTLNVEAGELFYIPKGCAYHSYWRSDGEICFDSFGFLYFPFPTDSTYPLQTIPITDSIRPLLAQLSAHKEVDGLSVGLLYQILQLALPTMATVPKAARERLADGAITYMHRHPHDSIAQVAKACGVSESTLYGCLKRVYRKTPATLRQEVLVQQAIGLLTTTDLSVEEISDRLAFSSATYFRKVFKQHTGLSPRQMRRETPV